MFRYLCFYSYLLLLTIGFQASAYAWGRVGHEVICEIAYRELTPAVRTEVDRLIALDSEYETFRQSCMYADHMRGLTRARAKEHYVNYPRDLTEVTTDECPTDDPCVLSAIKDDYAVLLLSDTTDAQKLEALKYLSHWVGDIHQPLHVSFSSDRGGNEIRVRGLCSGNLHGTWDGCLIRRVLGDDVDVAATELLEAHRERENQLPKTSLDLTLWVSKSFLVSFMPTFGYCVPDNGVCKYDEDTIEFEGKKRTVLIDEKYIDNNGPIVRVTVTFAGVRLAAMLNAALAE